MKKKNIRNFMSPLLVVLAAAMLVMSVVSLWWNPFIFLGEFIFSAAALAIVILCTLKLKRYIAGVISVSVKSIELDGQAELEKVHVPAAIIGKNHEILIANRLFSEKLCADGEPNGEDITDYLSNGNPSSIYTENGTDTLVQGRWYAAMGVKTGEGSIVYFIDNNTYKTNSDLYISSRPVVAIVAFDNREELEREKEDGKASRITAEVEQTIIKWVNTTSGFYKKLSGGNGRYVVVMEECHLKRFIDEKFPVLEEVRSIKINDRVAATVSMGIGHGGSSFKENELWARQALDMALGRGGDQVAVKKAETYKFFGGVSKGIEKRDKVRTRLIAAQMTTHINASSNVLIMGHKYSDLDAVGASIGMWSAASRGLKKPAYIVIDREQTLAKALVESFGNAGLGDIFISESEALDLVDDKTLLVIVDTHSPNFVESKLLYQRCQKRTVVIDHHRMMVNHIDSALVFYHEPYASSACEMTAELVQYIGSESLSRLESEALLSGIMLDTKNFVLRTGVRTFEAAAYLRSSGADTVEVKRLFSNSFDTYKVKYKLVSEAEIFNYCAIASADEDVPDIRIASSQAADELLGIENVKASFVIYKTGRTANISARSLGDLNVQLIMEKLGGGGHQTMAACQLENTSMSEAREKLVSIISEIDLNRVEQKQVIQKS